MGWNVKPRAHKNRRAGKDITGLTSGRLTAIEPTGERHPKHGGYLWRCRCLCGNDLVITVSQFMQGSTKSCGCLRTNPDGVRSRHSILGLRFGSIVVIAEPPRESNKAYRKVLCRCDCGVEQLCISTRVRRGEKTQCSTCAHQALLARNEERRLSPYLYVLRGLIQNAKTRGIDFLLTFEQTVAMITAPCHYCGLPHTESNTRTIRRIGVIRYSGIDRVDSSLPYIDGNVVPCCKQCNTAKNAYSQAEFLTWLRRVVAHQAAKGEIIQFGSRPRLTRVK